MINDWLMDCKIGGVTNKKTKGLNNKCTDKYGDEHIGG